MFEILLLFLQVKRRMAEKEEEARLSREELELRLSSLENSDGGKKELLQELETTIVSLKAAR